MLRRNTQANSRLKMSNMSIEKSPQPSQKKRQQKQNLQIVKEVVHGGNSTRHHALVKDQLPGNPGVLFTCSVPRTATTRVAHIVIKNTVYLISNWTGDKFPNVIYISLAGFTSGYTKSTVTVDAQGVSTFTQVGTDRIAALELDQVNAVLDDSGVRTYELKYTLRDSVYWKIPQSITRVKLSIKTDDSDLIEDLPLPNPMTLNLEIRVE